MNNENNGPETGGQNYSNQQQAGGQYNNGQQNFNPNNSQYNNQQGGGQQYNGPQFDPNTQQFNPNFNQNNGFVPPQGYQPKSKVAAGILGILLGTLGIHNFYLGFKGKAIAQLLISVLTCGLGTPITGVWGLIEGIMILTGSIAVDANGVPLTQ